MQTVDALNIDPRDRSERSDAAHSTGSNVSAILRLDGRTQVSSSLREMTDPPRSLYRLVRYTMVDRELPSGVHVRAVSDSDDAAFAVLMERAYAGMTDEQLGDNKRRCDRSRRLAERVGAREGERGRRRLGRHGCGGVAVLGKLRP